MSDPCTVKPDTLGLVHGGPTSLFTKEVSVPLHLGNPETAAGLVAAHLAMPGPIKDAKHAHVLLTSFLQWLLDERRYIDAATLLWRPNLFSGEPHAVKLMWENLFTHATVMVPGAASMGKCLRADTPILLFDGRVVPASEVKEGDLLRGDDNSPRKVLAIDRGTAPMFSVKSISGEWQCTGNHKLVLECALDKPNGHGGKISTKFCKGRQVEVLVSEYLGWSANRRRYFKQIKAGADFPYQKVEYDPYVYGCWLGDGSTDSPAVTKTPGPMLDYWLSYFSSLGFRNVPNKKKGNKACTWFARANGPGRPNPFADFTRTSRDHTGRRILSQYLRNDRATRLAVLAGLIDTDGWAQGSCFQIVTKYAGLKDDILFLARSLGFRATAWQQRHTIKSSKFSGMYWRTYIYGALEEIPTLEKKPKRVGTRSGRLECFELAPAEPAPYVGLLVDGNHRFLLGDFTVVHNSYSLGVWLLLDWLRDPAFTNVQVIGPSEKHLERNLFSHLVKLHRQAAIPLPGVIRELEISTDAKQKDSGIFGVVVPVGRKASVRIQGVKIVLRPQIHPHFGPTSRIRFMLEEAEGIPAGIWEDVVNIMANSAGSVERFKVMCPFNPKDPNSQVALRVEPKDGWGSIDVETSEVWDSRRGWRVVRLDGFKSENVVQGREVFYGLQTKPGLEKLIQEAGGVGTPQYYTMARGWYPPQGVDLAVIPQHLLNDLAGKYEFGEMPKPIAAVDVALEGGDNAVLVLGRIGRATGWRRAKTDTQKDELIRFTDDDNNPVGREVIQVDQIFTLPKGDTLKLVAEIRRVCRGADVKGPLLGVDRTGNGAGVHDLLVAQFHGSVRGINPSSAATERKILEEDTKLPCDEYQYLISELWFGLRKYIEFGFLKVDPQIPQDPLWAELGGRRFLLTQQKTKVESKKDYRSRGNKSPDRADALTMLVHVARLNSSGPPSISGKDARADDGQPCAQRVGVTDRREEL